MHTATYSVRKKRRRTGITVDSILGIWKEIPTSEFSCISTSSEHDHERQRTPFKRQKQPMYASRRRTILSSPDPNQESVQHGPSVQEGPSSNRCNTSIRPPERHHASRAVPSSPSDQSRSAVVFDSSPLRTAVYVKGGRHKRTKPRVRPSDLIADLHSFIPPQTHSPHSTPSGKQGSKSLYLQPVYATEPEKLSRANPRSSSRQVATNFLQRQKCLSAFPQPAFGSQSAKQNQAVSSVQKNCDSPLDYTSRQNLHLMNGHQPALSKFLALSIPNLESTQKGSFGALPMSTALRSSLRVSQRTSQINRMSIIRDKHCFPSHIHVERLHLSNQAKAKRSTVRLRSYANRRIPNRKVKAAMDTPNKTDSSTLSFVENLTPFSAASGVQRAAIDTDIREIPKVQYHGELDVDLEVQTPQNVTTMDAIHSGSNPIEDSPSPKSMGKSPDVFSNFLGVQRDPSSLESSRTGTHRSLHPMTNLFPDLLETARSVAASKETMERRKRPKYTETKIEQYIIHNTTEAFSKRKGSSTG